MKPSHPLLGHLPEFAQNPLGFLTQCASEDRDIVPLRLFHKSAFLLLAPADIERVLVTDHTQFRKPDWLRSAAVRRLLGDSLVTTEGEAWRVPREVSQPAFHARLLNDYGNTLVGLTEARLAHWKAGDVRDVQSEMTHLTLEIIVRTLFRVNLEGWTEAVEASMNVLMARFSSRSSLYGMIPWSPSKPERDAVRQINEIVDRLIADYQCAEKLSSEDEQGLVSRLQAAGAAGKPGFSELQIREHLKTFLAAGYESSALSLAWAFFLLAQHPNAEIKMANELKTVLHENPPTAEDLPRLVYTKAVIKETLRLYPPLWMTGRQTLKPYSIGRVSIPAGALLMTSQWAMHRNSRYFTDPDTFRPERWLNGEAETLPRYAYFPFGGGPRVCIGQGFALMELALVLASVLRRFRPELVTESNTEITPWATMMLRPSQPVQIKFICRSH